MREIELIETAHTGAMFTTTVQVASHAGSLAILASLSATPGSTAVAPMRLYPRCPGIIRALIEAYSDWSFGGQPVPLAIPFDATSEKHAIQLCDAILSKSRRLPLLVVSNDSDEIVWKDLSARLAYHLVGLADVAFVDAESSWVLTDKLGKQDSCYLGAVRLYWPGVQKDEGLWGTTWTASRLLAFGEDEAGMNRFLSMIRQVVMSAAALAIETPKAIREVLHEASRQRLKALEVGAHEQELTTIIDENARLSSDLEEARRTIANLNWKLQILESRNESENPVTEDDPETRDDSVGHFPPEKGELRFYKKIGSGGGVDTLVVTKACNHKSSSWKSAFKGDKAEKGLLKLEGSSDWQSIAHCGACTGGGRWRVQW